MQDCSDYTQHTIALIQELRLMELFRPREEDQEWLQKECGMEAAPEISDRDLVFRFLDWMLEQNRTEELCRLAASGCHMAHMIYDYIGYEQGPLQLWGRRDSLDQEFLQAGISIHDHRILLAAFALRRFIIDTEYLFDVDCAIQSAQEIGIDGFEYPYCLLIDSPICTPIEFEHTDISEFATVNRMMTIGRQTVYHISECEGTLSRNEIRNLVQRYQDLWSVWLE